MSAVGSQRCVGGVVPAAPIPRPTAWSLQEAGRGPRASGGPFRAQGSDGSHEAQRLQALPAPGPALEIRAMNDAQNEDDSILVDNVDTTL